MRLQWIGNLSMPKKLALMIFPPLLAFLVYAGMYVDNTYQNQNQLNTVLTLSKLSVVNGALVHELQKERGMSAGFIGSKGHSFAQKLPPQRSLTNKHVSKYQTFIKNSQLPAKFSSKLNEVSKSLQNLTNIRDQVDALTISLADEVAYYTNMNAILLSLVDSAANESQNSELSIKIKAFGAFLQLKERAGIERAVLSSTFGQSGFKPGAYRKFITLVSEQNTYAERYKASASAEMNRQFDQIMSGSQVQAVQRLRDLAFTQNSADIQAQSPETWFQTSTARIGVLTAFEQQLAKELIRHTENELSSAQTNLYVAITLVILLTLFVLSMSIGLSRYLHRSLLHIQKQVVYAGEHADMSIRLEQQYNDEFGQLAAAFNLMMDDFEDIISKVKYTSASLLTVVEQVNQFTHSLKQDVDNGYSEVDQVASAMTEMSATVNEIAQHAVSTAEVSAKANTQAQAGNQDVLLTSEAIGTLHNEITEAGKSIEQLDNDIQSIVSILDVISAIAEQTNLLALNAAIEAARAGDQGRGFAVVADEVRTLAQRSQTSTEDIKGMTDRLKAGAIVAVKAMSRGQSQANNSVTEAEHAREVLTEIVTLVREIDSMNEQIAAATHEQSAVAEEVSRNAMQISDIYVNTQEAANKISDLNMTLHNDAAEMNEQVSKFILSSKSSS